MDTIKNEILINTITNICGEEAIDTYTKNMVQEFKDEVISLDIVDEPGWQVVLYETNENENGFIYVSFNIANLRGMLDAVEIYKRLIKIDKRLYKILNILPDDDC